LRVDPRNVHHQDEEAWLAHHPLGQDDAGPDFLEPPLWSFVFNMQLHLASRHSPLQLIRLRVVEEMRNRAPVRCPSRLGRNDIDEQEERQENDHDVEAPARIQAGDNARPNAEPDRQAPSEAKTPDTQPNPHATTLSPDIVRGNHLLMRRLGHERAAEEIEERGQLVDVREAHGHSR